MLSEKAKRHSGMRNVSAARSVCHFFKGKPAYAVRLNCLLNLLWQVGDRGCVFEVPLSYRQGFSAAHRKNLPRHHHWFKTTINRGEHRRMYLYYRPFLSKSKCCRRILRKEAGICQSFFAGSFSRASPSPGSKSAAPADASSPFSDSAASCSSSSFCLIRSACSCIFVNVA